MTTITLGISGMTCDHCATTAQNALNQIPGVSARVSFEDCAAEINTKANVPVQHLLDALGSNGYSGKLLQRDGRAVNGEDDDAAHVVIIGTGSGAFSAATLQVDPSFALALFHRGMARDATHDVPGAIADLERFLELAPRHSAAGNVRTKLRQLRGEGE